MATVPTVLIVEAKDDERTLLTRVLAAEEYAVVPARNARDALRVLHARSLPVEILICGLGLPGLDGFEVASRIGERWPVKVLFLYEGSKSITPSVEGMIGGYGFLRKPFSPEQLVDAVRQIEAQETPSPVAGCETAKLG